MSRQSDAVLRLEASRIRMRAALIEDQSAGTMVTVLLQLVQRHPLAAAGLAMALGGLAVRIKPWRWLLRAELWAAVLPGLLSALAAAPLSSWADVMSMFMRRSKPAHEQAPVPTDAPPT
jgi:hypothetical protein